MNYKKIVEIATKKSLEEIKKIDFNLIKNIFGNISHKYPCLYPPLFSLKKYDFKKEINILPKTIDLYIHIPFCSRKCTYCSFKIEPEQKLMDNYVEALIEEIKSYKKENLTINFLDFGGGTPNTLSLSQMKKINEAINESFNFNKKSMKSIEIHPEFIKNKNYLPLLKKYFNRISIGIESFDDNILKKLNRGHSKKEAIESIKKSSKYFKNISIDLLYGFKELNLKSWKETLTTSLSLRKEINEISACKYSKAYYSKNEVSDIKETTLFELISLNALILSKWHPYQSLTSEFMFHRDIKYIKKNNELRILGLGTSSFSTTDNFILQNETNIQNYISKIKKYKKGISYYKERTATEKIIGDIIFNILWNSSLEPKYFHKKYSINIIKKYYKILKKLQEANLITIKNNIIKLTKIGVIFSDQIITLFIEPEKCKDYFLQIKKNPKLSQGFFDPNITSEMHNLIIENDFKK